MDMRRPENVLALRFLLRRAAGDERHRWVHVKLVRPPEMVKLAHRHVVRLRLRDRAPLLKLWHWTERLSLHHACGSGPTSRSVKAHVRHVGWE